VETYLARLGGFGMITVDGKQSAADCAAIKRFQRRYGISPVDGKAGPTTASVAARLANTDMHNPSIGSHGCINLLHSDAEKLWQLGSVGAKVHLFGHRAGT
jgi:peptidoglycan hydrolase-like protein with peptidoglycan-binding domain